MTLLNPSFELLDGLPATLQALAVGPYVLAEGLDLRVSITVAGQTTQQVSNITAGTFAVVLCAVGPYALVHGDTLDITVDGMLFPLVLDSADYDDITEARADELVQVIVAAIGPAIALGSGGGALSMGSPTQGSVGSIQVGGTAVSALGCTTDLVTGIDYFSDMSNVSVAELLVFWEATLAGLEFSAPGGLPTIATEVRGDDVELTVGGALGILLGFPQGPEKGVSGVGQALYWDISTNGSTWVDFELLPGIDAVPFEGFELGWETILAELPANDIDLWGVEPFGPAGWPLVLFAVGSSVLWSFERFDWVAAGFGSIDFNPPTAPWSTEDFSGWYSFTTTTTPTDGAEFTIPVGGPFDTETFGDHEGPDNILDPQAVTSAQFVAEWLSPVPPIGVYRVRVDTFVVAFEQLGGSSRSLIAEQLAIKINAVGGKYRAFVVDEALRIWREDQQDFIVVPDNDPSIPSTEMRVVNAEDATTLVGFWTHVVGLEK